MSKGRGSFVRVQIGPNRFVKMYEGDAIKKGYEYTKEKPKSRNKQLLPQETKSTQDVILQGEPDDFSEISGVGKSTRDELYKMGISTFDQLLNTEDLSGINALGMKAILEWKESLLPEEPEGSIEDVEEA